MVRKYHAIGIAVVLFVSLFYVFDSTPVYAGFCGGSDTNCGNDPCGSGETCVDDPKCCLINFDEWVCDDDFFCFTPSCSTDGQSCGSGCCSGLECKSDGTCGVPNPCDTNTCSDSVCQCGESWPCGGCANFCDSNPDCSAEQPPNGCEGNSYVTYSNPRCNRNTESCVADRSADDCSANRCSGNSWMFSGSCTASGCSFSSQGCGTSAWECQTSEIRGWHEKGCSGGCFDNGFSQTTDCNVNNNWENIAGTTVLATTVSSASPQSFPCCSGNTATTCQNQRFNDFGCGSGANCFVVSQSQQRTVVFNGGTACIKQDDVCIADFNGDGQQDLRDFTASNCGVGVCNDVFTNTVCAFGCTPQAGDDICTPNAPPTLNTLGDSPATVRGGQTVTITSSGTDVNTGDTVRLGCGTVSGTSNLCLTSFGSSATTTFTPSCTFASPFGSDSADHGIFCYLEDDKNSKSNIMTTTISADNAVESVNTLINPNPSFATGTSVTITGTASDARSGIGSVLIFVDGVQVKTCASSPCTHTFVPTYGGHTYFARAADGVGNSLDSATSSFGVNDPPTINNAVIVSGQCVTGATLTIGCTAADPNQASSALNVAGWAGECTAGNCFNTRSWVGNPGTTYFANSPMTFSGGQFTKTITITSPTGKGLAVTCQATDEFNNQSGFGDAYPLCIVNGCTNPPVISGLGVTPNPAKAGTIDIAFIIADTLQSNPTVTVKPGQSGAELPAAFSSKSGNVYHYSFTVASGHTNGVADVKVSAVRAGDLCPREDLGTFTIDTAAPTTTITCDDGPCSGQQPSGVTIKFQCTDPAPATGCASTRFSVDGGAEQIYNPASPPSLAGESVKVVRFHSIDAASNSEPENVQNVNVVIPPVLTSISATTPFTPWAKQGQSVTVTSVGSDPGGQNTRLRCGENSLSTDTLCPSSSMAASNPTCTFNSPWNDNSDHTIFCQLQDTGGALSVNTRSADIKADNSAPLVTSLTRNPSSAVLTSGTLVSITAAASDARSGLANVAVITDGSPTNCAVNPPTGSSSCSKTFTPSFGAHTVSTGATDAVGFNALTPPTGSFVVNDAPSISPATKGSQLCQSGAPLTVRCTATDPNSAQGDRIDKVRLWIGQCDGSGGTSTCFPTRSWAPAQSGIVYVDGNETTALESGNTYAKTITINQASGTWLAATCLSNDTLDTQSNFGDAYPLCQINGCQNPPTAVMDSIAPNPVGPGTNALTVKFNVSDLLQSPPTVTLKPGSQTGGTQILTPTSPCTKSGVTYTCNFDIQGSFANGIADVGMSFVRLSDACSGGGGPFTTVIDTAPPVTTITCNGGSCAGTFNGAVTIGLSCDPTVSTPSASCSSITYSFDGGAFQNYVPSSPPILSASGPHVVRVRSTDSAGNVENKQVNVQLDSCFGVSCNSPPKDVCFNSTHLTSFNTVGACSAGTCGYTNNLVSCQFGCEQRVVGNDVCVGTESKEARVSLKFDRTSVKPGETVDSEFYCMLRDKNDIAIRRGECAITPANLQITIDRRTLNEKDYFTSLGISKATFIANNCKTGTKVVTVDGLTYTINAWCDLPLDTSVFRSEVCVSASDGGSGLGGESCGNYTVSPCSGVTCNNPPDDFCANTTILTTQGAGACTEATGLCSYAQNNVSCQFGCGIHAGDDTCNADPCGGITCNPPADICQNSNTLRQFTTSACVQGACQDNFNDVPCQYGCTSLPGGAVCNQNTRPVFTVLNINPHFLKAGQNVAFTTTAFDPDNEQIRLRCGTTQGGTDLCSSGFVATNPSCSLTPPWVDSADHDVFCFVEDTAGAATTRSGSISADNTAPLLILDVLPNASMLPTNTRINFTATSSDARSGLNHINITVDNTVRQNCAQSACEFSFVPSYGAHTYNATTIDMVGNSNTAPTGSVIINDDPAVTAPISFTGTCNTGNTITLRCNTGDQNQNPATLGTNAWAGHCDTFDCFATKVWTLTNSPMTSAGGGLFTKDIQITDPTGTCLVATCQATDEFGAKSNFGDSYPLCEVGSAAAPTLIVIDSITPNPAPEGPVTITFTVNKALSSNPIVIAVPGYDSGQRTEKPVAFISKNGNTYTYRFNVADNDISGLALIKITGVAPNENCPAIRVTELLIDNSPPSTDVLCNLQPCQPNRVYRSPMLLTFRCADSLTSCSETKFGINGPALQTYDGTTPPTIVTTGTFALSYESRDDVGNQETGQRTIKVYDAPCADGSTDPGCTPVEEEIRMYVKFDQNIVLTGETVTGRIYCFLREKTDRETKTRECDLSDSSFSIIVDKGRPDEKDYFQNSGINRQQFLEDNIRILPAATGLDLDFFRYQISRFWAINLDSSVFRSDVCVNGSDNSSGLGGEDCGSYVVSDTTIDPRITFPDFVQGIIPATTDGTNSPNFTKLMPISFELRPYLVQPIGSGSLCSGINCRVDFSFDPYSEWTLNAPKVADWSTFDNAYIPDTADVTSNNFDCNEYQTLFTRTTVQGGDDSGLTQDNQTDVFINCDTKLTIAPVEVRYAVGQSVGKVFDLTLWSPSNNQKTFQLDATTSLQSGYPLQWTSFDCGGVGGCVVGPVTGDSWLISDDRARIDVPPVSSKTIQITMPFALKSGGFPINFIASSQSTGEIYSIVGNILIFSEGLDEFQPWQFIALLGLAATYLLFAL